jgi:hypothetical protein
VFIRGAGLGARADEAVCWGCAQCCSLNCCWQFILWPEVDGAAAVPPNMTGGALLGGGGCHRMACWLSRSSGERYFFKLCTINGDDVGRLSCLAPSRINQGAS